MSQLSASEKQALEEMEPHEFHRVLLQIVASGLTAWREEPARRSAGNTRSTRSSYSLRAAAVAHGNVELTETFV